MMRSAAESGVNREFDQFLQAPIDENGNGMLLSVISALARLDIDPWQEAAELSELSNETATRRLAALIAALPAAPPLERNPTTIAARLITLLPRHLRARSTVAQPKDPAETKTYSVLRKVAFIVLLCLFLISVIASQVLNSTQTIVAPETSPTATSLGR